MHRFFIYLILLACLLPQLTLAATPLFPPDQFFTATITSIEPGRVEQVLDVYA